jgi:hypothetical protein
VTPEQRQRLYDEIVEVELAHPNGGGNAFGLYWRALFDYCETPEALLAGQLVSERSYTPHNVAPTKRYPTFAAVRWPWGDARGVLRAGGRTHLEARLRLRDKLVESARSVVSNHEPQTREAIESLSKEEQR